MMMPDEAWLRASLLDFFEEEKAEDRYASVPELIRRARELGGIGPHQWVDPTSIWRACSPGTAAAPRAWQSWLTHRV
jgi:hypothetical protein